MTEPDDKTITTKSEVSSGNDDVSHKGNAAPFAERDGGESDERSGGAQIEDLIKVGIKAVAATLSVVFLLLAILTVAMPLSAMRTFYKLGWSERALNSGDRYITRRLEKSDADVADPSGNFTALAASDLNDEDMREAYDVCISLSRGLMTSTARKGDTVSAKYFAEKLELYTRQYMSLGGISTNNRQKSEHNVANVGDLRLRPFVYDYAHTVMLDNFRARTYTGELDKMLYDGAPGHAVLDINSLSNTYNGGLEFPDNPTSAQIANVIDGFVDYVDQLGAYLSVKFDMLGLPSDFDGSDVAEKYSNILDGSDFELFIKPVVSNADGVASGKGGYTNIYKNLEGGFTKYAQMAADFNAQTIDDELHKLYWLQALGNVSTKLWYMSLLLYYDKTGSYAMLRDEIEQEYYPKETCAFYKFVQFDLGDGFGRKLTDIKDVYNYFMNRYIAHFAAA